MNAKDDPPMGKKPYKVLVIDDEHTTLTMFNLFLTAFGYEVLTAENGNTAMALVQAHQPAIVFTDLKMPEMDGFQVLKEIKRLAPRTEVIVITGHGDMDLMVQALNLDATDFINKPIRRSALESALQRAESRLQSPSPSTCTITFNLQQGVGQIQIQGTLDRECRGQLQESCRQARETAGKGILFKFMKNSAANGTGIAALINCLSAFNRNNLPVAIVGLSENFKTIFQMVGVSRFAALVDTEDQALDLFLKADD